MPLPLVPLLGLAANALPSLIGLINKDAGKVAGEVAGIAKQLFGTDDAGAVERAIAADPAKALEWKLALAGYEDREKQRTHDEVMQRIADVDSARKRDAGITTAGKHNWRADILAFLACAGLIVCVWLVANNLNLPERAVNAIMFVAGVFASAVRDVFTFEFGSSRGSHAKDEVIKSMIK